MHLFISKGVVADTSSVVDNGMTISAHQQEQHQRQDWYQQLPARQYQNQQNNQPPPPEQQYYHQQPQGQHNQYTNQLYLHQQFNYPQSDVSYHPQSNYNQYNDRGLPSPRSTQYHYHDNPALSQFNGPRNQPYRTNSYQPFNVMSEAMVKEPVKPVRPPTPPKIGWTCPICTVINEPYRPGCEVCGENRPEDYNPPADYKPTKDEMRWLQDELQEKLCLEKVC